MNKKRWNISAGIAANILLASTLNFSPAVCAAQTQSPTDKSNVKAKASQQPTGNQSSPTAVSKAAASKAAGGPHESLKVHGHWTIEVRNPDGRVATRREFDNALSFSGNLFLVSYLSRGNSVGIWTVELNGAGSVNSPCGTDLTSASICYITEASSTLNTPTTFKTLTVTGPESSSPTTNLVLSGNATALVTGEVGTVSAGNVLCPNTTPPSTPCTAGSSSGPVTLTTLSAPISVQAGQVIQVQVIISFS